MTLARSAYGAGPPILVAVALRGDDQPPVALGRRLARVTGAPVVLATILDDDEDGAAPEAALEVIAAPLRAEHEVRVRTFRAPTATAGLRALVCDEAPAALVIGSTRNRRLRRDTPEGVTAWSLRGAPCALAIAPRGACDHEAPLRRIGAAFADSGEGHDVVAAAVELATLAGGSVRVLTTLEPQAAESGRRGPDGVDERERASAALIGRRGRRLVPVELRVGHDNEVLVGYPADALGCVSREVDLLVCGPPGLGSSHDTSAPPIRLESHDVVDNAFCAVLLIPHPDGSSPTPLRAPTSATFVTK